MLAVVLHRDGPDAVVAATIAIQAISSVAPRDHERDIQLVADSVTSEGREEGLHQAILTFLAARGFELDEPTRARILACDQLEELAAMVARAATISTLAELFG